MIRIELATHDALKGVVRHLRPDDREELAATALDADLDDIPWRVMRFAVMAFVACGPQPIAAWGFTRLWPGVGVAFAFGTPEWGRALLPMTRHVKGFMMPALVRQGYHRIEARGLARRADTARWMRVFGASPEAVLRGFGKNREDFVLYRWLDERRAETSRASEMPCAARQG